METTLHIYEFDTRKPEDAAKYDALCERLKGQGLTCFETHGRGSHFYDVQGIDGQTIPLDLGHLFDNQWNTGPIPGQFDEGVRVFDWAQDYRPFGSDTIKRGHYLEQTEEMREV